MKKKVLLAFLILVFLLLIIFSNIRTSYQMSMCAYCGAGRNIEGKIIGKTIKEQPPIFPSQNPPDHNHLFILCAIHNSGAYFDCNTDDLDIMFQLKELNDKNQLSGDVIKEWFSIDIRNPEVLENFVQKHNLEIIRE